MAGTNMTSFREITIDGRTASFVLYNGALTVRLNGHYKTTAIGGGHHTDIAARLLRELIAEGA